MNARGCLVMTFGAAVLWALIFAAALALTGCGGRDSLTPPEPIVKTVEVKVAVPVPCPALAKLGEEPSYADTDAALSASPDIFESARLLLKGRLQRTKRLVEYGAAKISCVF